MTTEPYVIDKSKWPDGPWQTEPDRVEWQHAGYACLMLRNDRMGHWCGYVGVPLEHPYYGVDHKDIEPDLGVHGGLTYSGYDFGPICHIAPGQPDDALVTLLLWWLGFDCAHAWDLNPWMYRRPWAEKFYPGATYRDFAYVQAQTNSLASQLSIMSSNTLSKQP